MRKNCVAQRGTFVLIGTHVIGELAVGIDILAETAVPVCSLGGLAGSVCWLDGWMEHTGDTHSVRPRSVAHRTAAHGRQSLESQSGTLATCTRSIDILILCHGWRDAHSHSVPWSLMNGFNPGSIDSVQENGKCQCQVQRAASAPIACFLPSRIANRSDVRQN